MKGWKEDRTMKIRDILLIIIFIVLVIQPITSLGADIDQNAIASQEETFGITSFIQNSKQYTGDFFEDIDVGDILNSAIKGDIDNSKIYKKILNSLGKEVQTGIKSLISILVIIIIHSILNVYVY